MPVLHEYVLAPLAINVAVVPEQIVDEFTVTVGKGVTETFAIPVLVQPDAVPVTVYVVFNEGEAVNVLEVVPVLHTYVDAPLAVNVADVPLQITTEFTEIVGLGVTNMFAVDVLLQPFVVPITEKVVLEVGEIVNGFMDEPVFQV